MPAAYRIRQNYVLNVLVCKVMAHSPCEESHGSNSIIHWVLTNNGVLQLEMGRGRSGSGKTGMEHEQRSLVKMPFRTVHPIPMFAPSVCSSCGLSLGVRIWLHGRFTGKYCS